VTLEDRIGVLAVVAVTVIERESRKPGVTRKMRLGAKSCGGSGRT
jgi:hypothetical protein